MLYNYNPTNDTFNEATKLSHFPLEGKTLGLEIHVGHSQHYSVALGNALSRGDKVSEISQILLCQKSLVWDFPGGPVAKILCYQWRGPGFDPWSGNYEKSHMQQLRVCMMQLKIPHAPAKDPKCHK